MTRVNSVPYDKMIMCYTTEFSRDTTEDDGAILMVVDKSADKVVQYCMAYGKRWIDL